MSDFDKWAGDLADSIKDTTSNTKSERKKVDAGQSFGMIDEDLWEYNVDLPYDDPWIYPCRVCDKDHVVEDHKDFDPDMHYCGGSPSCCP